MKSDPAYYTTWRRYLHNDWHPELPADIGRFGLLAIAVCIADHGSFGIGCFPSDRVIGLMVERDRNTVRRYRHFLVRLRARGDG